MMHTFAKKYAKPIAAMTLICASVMSLQGCVAIAAGGAVAGTMMSNDRRTMSAQNQDRLIVTKSNAALDRKFGSASRINVDSFNSRVLLTGQVPDAETKAAAEREITAVEGVLSVTNELEIGFTSSLSTRANDLALTTKVKASLVNEKDIYSNVFKIVTENGTVFLMGRVTAFEGKVAADVTRGIAGVKKVVKVFEYIDEGDAKQLIQPTPAAN
jgi:osmotically-inducible protein OsmY